MIVRICVFAVLLQILSVNGQTTAPNNVYFVLFTHRNLDINRLTLIFNASMAQSTCLSSYALSPKTISDYSLIPTAQQLAASQIQLGDKRILVEIGPKRLYGPDYFPGNLRATRLTNLPQRVVIQGFQLSNIVRMQMISKLVQSWVQPSQMIQIAFLVQPSIFKIEEDPYTEIDPFVKLPMYIGMVRIFIINNITDAYNVPSLIYANSITTIVSFLDAVMLDAVFQACYQQNYIAVNKWFIMGAGSDYYGNKYPPVSSNYYRIEFNYKFGSPVLQTITSPITELDAIVADMSEIARIFLEMTLCTKPADADNIFKPDENTGEVNSEEITNIVLSQPAYDVRRADIKMNNTFYNIGTFNINFTLNKQTAIIFWQFVVIKAFLNTTIRLTNITITPSNDINIAAFNVPDDNLDNNVLLALMRQRPVRVLMMNIPPFFYYSGSTPSMPLNNGTGTGYLVDLLAALFAKLNVTYTVTVYNERSGSMDSKGQWSNGFGLLQKRFYDVFAGPLVGNVQRSNSFQSSIPFLFFQYILAYKPTNPDLMTSMFRFVWPFSGATWGIIFGFACAYAIALIGVTWLSPNLVPYNPGECILFPFAAIVQGNGLSFPDRLSSRILFIFWWAFCLLMVIMLTVNYGAYKAHVRILNPIVTITDLLQQNTMQYGIVQNSELDRRLGTSSLSEYRQLYTFMHNIFKNVTVDFPANGFTLVDKGDYAFIVPEPILQYYAQYYCLTTSGNFENDVYTLFSYKNYQFTSLINTVLSNFSKDGTLTKLAATYLQPPTTKSSNCGNTNLSTTIANVLSTQFLPLNKYSASFIEIFGIICIVVCGLLLVLCVACIEVIVIKIMNFAKNYTKHNKKKSSS